MALMGRISLSLKHQSVISQTTKAEPNFGVVGGNFESLSHAKLEWTFASVQPSDDGFQALGWTVVAVPVVVVSPSRWPRWPVPPRLGEPQLFIVVRMRNVAPSTRAATRNRCFPDFQPGSAAGKEPADTLLTDVEKGPVYWRFTVVQKRNATGDFVEAGNDPDQEQPLHRLPKEETPPPSPRR